MDPDGIGRNIMTEMHGDTNETDEECEAAMDIEIDVPELTDQQPRIMVIGVGGAGGNAIDNMIEADLTGVEFVAANTDAQALAMSSADCRIQIGVKETEGLGAGTRPEIGKAAAEEAAEDIREQISGSSMVFIAAGMGGGTGTGAAPVIARIAREEDILTVGVVTKPFHYEGRRRMKAAEAGIEELKKHVDTLIVIPNQNLFRIVNEKTPFQEAFKLADQVLHSGVACITDLLFNGGLVNLDFSDVEIVTKDMGAAIMGTGEAGGENRALIAAGDAMTNPLLDDISLKGAKGILISIVGGPDLTLTDMDQAANVIGEEIHPDATFIVGTAMDKEMEGRIRVSIVATGLRETKREEVQQPHHSIAPEQRGQHPDASMVDPRQSMRAPAVQFGKRGTTLAPEEDAEVARRIQEAPPAWQGPGNVTIEQRPPQLHAGTNLPPAESTEPASQGQQFAPAPPANGKRPLRRMPELKDLPPIAQEEIKAKRTKQYNTGVGAPKKKVGIFERLAGVGRVRKASDSAEISPEHAWPGSPPPAQPPMRSPRNEPHGHPVNKLERMSANSEQPRPNAKARNASSSQNLADGCDDVEFPEFLHRKIN